MRRHLILYSVIQFEKFAVVRNDPEIWIAIFCLVGNASALGIFHFIDRFKFIIMNQKQ